MSNITSAGTLAGAVFQTSGLAAQERMLTDFAPMFESLGALLYIVAGIGAVISATMFGNFRMARYLLVGPVFLFVLLGVRVEASGTIWKLGGGAPRTVEGEALSEESSAHSSFIVEDANYEVKEEATDSYQVSWAFNWFTSKIDGLVNGLVDVILQYENDEDLDFISRTEALNSLALSKTDNPLITDILVNGFGNGCPKMMGASYALSSAALSTGDLTALIAASEEEGDKDLSFGRYTWLKERLDKRRNDYQEIYNDSKVNEKFNLDDSIIKYMQTYPSIQSVQDYFNDREKTGPEQLSHSDVMTCGTMWKILSEAVVYNARGFNNELFDKFAVHDKDPVKLEKNKDRLCREIARNLSGDGYRDLYLVGDSEDDKDPLHCDLVAMTTVFMLRNTLLSQSTMTTRLQELKNNMQTIASTDPREKLVPITKNPEELELFGSGNSPEVRFDKPSGFTVVAFQRKNCSEKECQKEWYPISVLGKVGGHFDTAFNEHQSFLIRGIRQGIFHWSAQLPYYQGVLLYCFSIAYPFFALIVVLPSHARLFFYLPLAWLWVKSWDVGFALVMILERVLWNMFPKTDLALGSSTGLSAFGPPLPNVLHEAMRVDPTFHSHAYYFMISLALLAIPSITGYAVLRGRSQALASFTDGPRQMAKAAQDRAESAYGISRIADKQQALNARKGVAMLPHISGYQFGTELANNGGNHVQAASSARMSDLKQAFKETAGLQAMASGAEITAKGLGGLSDQLSNKRKNAKGLTGDLFQSLATGGQGFASKFNTLHSAENRKNADLAGMFDTYYGSQGIRARILRGGIAAEEASTFSFEAGDNQYANEVVDTVISYYKDRQKVRQEAYKEAIENIARGLPELASNSKLNDSARNKFAANVVSQAFKGLFGGGSLVGLKTDNEFPLVFNNKGAFEYVGDSEEQQIRHITAEIDWLKRGLTGAATRDFCQASGDCRGLPAVQLESSQPRSGSIYGKPFRKKTNAFKDHTPDKTNPEETNSEDSGELVDE